MRCTPPCNASFISSPLFSSLPFLSLLFHPIPDEMLSDTATGCRFLQPSATHTNTHAQKHTQTFLNNTHTHIPTLSLKKKNPLYHCFILHTLACPKKKKRQKKKTTQKHSLTVLFLGAINDLLFFYIQVNTLLLQLRAVPERTPAIVHW